MKSTLIIYHHPYNRSFNSAILKSVCDALDSVGRSYDVIDLCADDFDPRYSSDELALFSRGQTLDPLVSTYQEKLMNADKVIFITPIWWSSVPATVKGFLDKVMKLQFAYLQTSLRVRGMLTHIKSVVVITTSASPTWYLRWFCGNSVKRAFLGAAIKQIGVRRRRWVNCGRVKSISPAARQRFLARVQKVAL